MANAYVEASIKVHQALRSRGIRLALAESCTGGYIAHLITSNPGASEYFDVSYITYSRASKINTLGISLESINRYGTISPECALEMAIGASRAARTVAALSVTGNLGPDPIENKEAGLVYVAVLLRGRTKVREFRFRGDRDEIKEMAAGAALDMLHEAVTTWT